AGERMSPAKERAATARPRPLAAVGAPCPPRRTSSCRSHQMESALVWSLIRAKMGNYFCHGHNVRILEGHVVEIGEMRALVLVGYALLGDDGAVAVREAVDDGRTHAA